MKRWIKRAALGVAGLAFLGGAVVISGIVPVGASSGHFEITAWFLHFTMKRSVKTHSLGIEVPELDDPRLVLIGAGHYEHGCRFCHGIPGTNPPRVALGMTPHPPDLVESIQEYDDSELFYVVRHGVKFTGMPAWPAETREDEVWPVVAFLRALPELDPEDYRRLVHGKSNPQNGAPEVVTRLCARCHGTDGLGRGAFPRLAAQRPLYLAGALDAYVRRTRPSGIMEPIAAMLTRDEAVAAVDWYTSREPSREHGDGDISAGEAIATRGIPKRRIPACTHCHGPGKEPHHPAYPKLAGQYAHYLEQQLHLFIKGVRGGSPYGNVMHTVASHALELDEIRQVARYYASLPGEPADSHGR